MRIKSKDYFFLFFLILGLGSIAFQKLVEPVRESADFIFLVSFLVFGGIIGMGIIKSKHVSSRKKLSVIIFVLSLAIPAAYWFFEIKEVALELIVLIEEWLGWAILISIIGLGIAYIVKKDRK